MSLLESCLEAWIPRGPRTRAHRATLRLEDFASGSAIVLLGPHGWVTRHEAECLIVRALLFGVYIRAPVFWNSHSGPYDVSPLGCRALKDPCGFGTPVPGASGRRRCRASWRPKPRGAPWKVDLIHICVCAYIYIYIVYIYKQIHACICVYVHIHMCVYSCTYMCT